MSATLPPSPLAAEDDHEAVFLDGLDEYFDARNVNLVELLRQGSTLFSRDPASAAVRDVAVAVDRAEIAADRNVVGPHSKADPRRLENAATDLVLQRVVAKQAKVPWAAARRDARFDWNRTSGDAFSSPRRRDSVYWLSPTQSARPVPAAVTDFRPIPS